MNYSVILFGLIMEFFIIYNYFNSVLERRFTYTKTAILFSIIGAVNIVRCLLMLNYMMLKILFGFIFLWFIMMLLYKDKLYKKIVVCITYTLSALLAEIIGTFIAKYIYRYDLSEMTAPTISCYMWQGTVYLLLFAFTTISLLILKRRNIDSRNKVIQYVYLYATIQVLILCVLYILTLEFRTTASYLPGVLIFVMLASFITAMLIYRAVKIMAVKNAEAEFIEKEAEIKDRHFLQLRKQYMEYRRLRHDFYNHIKTIDHLHDPVKQQEYIDMMKKKLDRLEQISYCSNPTLDALLSVKLHEAMQAGVNARCFVCDINDIKITDFDLCTVVSNLLDNAIEAAKKTSERYLKIEINKKTDRLIILVKNSTLKVLPNLETTKNDKSRHGIGIESIKNVAEKYDGDVVFKYHNDEFISVITLKCI